MKTKMLLQIDKLLKIIPRFRSISTRYKHSEKVIVKPLKSLVTEHVSIYGEGFQPDAPITIKACVDCKSERLSFMSFGHFVTSHEGHFDLSQSESIGGTYTGIDDMGLFWSMAKTGNSVDRSNVNNASVELIYDFEVYHGHHTDMDWCIVPTCKTTISRLYMPSNVKREVLNDQFKGSLFTPSGNGPFPAIIVLYGGLKRRQLIEDAAGILASNGFVTLALAYFGVEGLPKGYPDHDIQIESLENAVAYLSSLKIVNSNAIGVHGHSMGGAVGLGMASFLPQIKAVVSINGFITSLGSSMTYGEHVVTALSWKLDRSKDLNDGTVLFNMTNPQKEPSSIIPIEKSSAEILFIVGSEDENSIVQAHVAKKRMDDLGKRNYEIVQYPGMGHMVDAPFMPVINIAGNPLVSKGTRIYYGGQDKMVHSIQQEKVWLKVISFFKEVLNDL